MDLIFEKPRYFLIVTRSEWTMWLRLAFIIEAASLDSDAELAEICPFVSTKY